MTKIQSFNKQKLNKRNRKHKETFFIFQQKREKIGFQFNIDAFFGVLKFGRNCIFRFRLELVVIREIYRYGTRTKSRSGDVFFERHP